MKNTILKFLLAGSLFTSLLFGADFSGTWQQDVSRSVPPGKSRRVREMRIEQNGHTLMVKQSAKTSADESDVNVTYEVGGKEVVFTGLDGDEFHTKVHAEGDSLVFETVEHEEGKEIVSKQTWTLAEDGKVLREAKQQKGAESVAVFVKK